MIVAFRVDASILIGVGHVMRCLTLAEELRTKGAVCRFICREHQGHFGALIRHLGFELDLLPSVPESLPLIGQGEYANWVGASWQEDARQTAAVLEGSERPDWLVVDHYGLDGRWEKSLRPYVGRILAIDDLADRGHDCDLLLDQNLGRNVVDYERHLPRNCPRLIGPNFALLRPSFSQQRQMRTTQSRRQPPKHILVSMGGVDKDNFTGCVLSALQQCEIPKGARVTVVLGSHAPWLEQIRQQVGALRYPVELRVDEQDIALLLCKVDLAIGAAGVSALERCCMGVPTLIIPIAENQWPGAIALEKTGAVVLLKPRAEIVADIAEQLPLLIANPALPAMADIAMSLCDGRGCGRVTAFMNYLMTGALALRRVEETDAALLFSWANDAETRANAINTEPIEWAGHVTWLGKKIAAGDDSVMLIGLFSPLIPFGQVRFDKGVDAVWIISFSIAPEFRYLGLGRSLLRAALKFLGRLFPHALVVGYVKPNNLASKRVFESLGFQGAGLADGLVVFKCVLGE